MRLSLQGRSQGGGGCPCRGMSQGGGRLFLQGKEPERRRLFLQGRIRRKAVSEVAPPDHTPDPLLPVSPHKSR